jgi:hypothetical protein
MQRQQVHEPTEYDGLFDADEDSLDRPVRAKPWFAFGEGLHLRGDHLEVDREAWQGHAVVPKRPMLEQFARLAAPGRDHAQAVLRYAQQWGLLELCQHQLPMDTDRLTDHEGMDLPFCFATTGMAQIWVTPSNPCRSLFGREPITTWLYLSRQAAAILAVVSRLREGQHARPEDWSTLGEEAPWVAGDAEPVWEMRGLAHDWTERLVAGHAPGPADSSGDDVRRDIERTVARGAIETWLRLGGAAFELRWPAQGRPEVGFRVGGLFGWLGVQMMLAAADSPSFAICLGCGLMFAPPRGPGRPRRYCDTCRDNNKPQQLADERRGRTKAVRRDIASAGAAARE